MANRLSDEFVIEMAAVYVYNKLTYREVARLYGTNKTTVYKSFKDRLPKFKDIDALYQDVRNWVAVNIQDAHNRGGRTTRFKFEWSHNEWNAPDTADIDYRNTLKYRINPHPISQQTIDIATKAYPDRIMKLESTLRILRGEI